MRNLCFWWCVLVACSSEGRVEVVVSSPPGTERVELFIGHGDKRTEALRPADQPAPVVDATWWTRDPAGPFDAQVTSGGPVIFGFVPGPATTMPAIVAVGFMGMTPTSVGAVLTSIAVPDDPQIDRYPINLVGFDALPRRSAPTQPGLQLWGPSAGEPHACVHVDGFEPDSHAMIVRDGDPDCDGFEDGSPLECIDREFMSRRALRRDDATCFAPDTISLPSSSVCTLGGDTCQDGRAADATRCEPSAYCAPATVCAHCSGLECAMDTAMIYGRGVTAIACPMKAYFDGSVERWCPNTVYKIQLPFQVPLGLVCGTPMLRDARPGFTTDLSVSSGAQIKISKGSQGGCVIEVRAEGPIPGDQDVAAIVAVSVSAPEKWRGLAAPILFTTEVVGTNTAYCQQFPEVSCGVLNAVSYETIATCLRTPPAPGTAVDE